MSKCWYCNNELTTGDNPKHFGICNKCYNEMFKSSDTIIRSFTNKISDLEAKLAESENNYKDARELGIEQFHSLKEIINSSQEEIYKLKQQLAEKDEELKYYETLLKRQCNECKDQDKISFAVEQLILLKNTIVNKMNNPYSVNIKHILSDFDNQINELKEMR